MTTQYKYLNIEDKKMIAEDRIKVLEAGIYQHFLDRETATPAEIIEIDQIIQNKTRSIESISLVLENLNAGIDSMVEY